MKKILFAIALVMMIGLGANAQRQRDAFVSNWDVNNRELDAATLGIVLPALGLGETGDPSAPLGSGLLVLTALGAGYALAKKRK